MDFYMWQSLIKFPPFFFKTGNTSLGYCLTRVCFSVCVCVLGSVLDQNVPSGFVFSLSHTLESIFCCTTILSCALKCLFTSWS